LRDIIREEKSLMKKEKTEEKKVEVVER